MRSSVLLIVLLVVFALLTAGCTQQQAPQPVTQTTSALTAIPTAAPTIRADTIRMASTSVGSILVDATRRTLYFYAKDEPGSSMSACTSGCISVWPVFFTETVMVSPPLSAADFSSFTRADGMKQTTYRGRPLYYYQPDVSPGEIRGHGFGNVWFVADVSGNLPLVPTPSPTTLHTLNPSGGGSY